VVYPPAAVVKVDDTGPGIAEGVAAGCLTVGVTLSGNYVGKTADELRSMPASAIAPLRDAAAARLRAAGADHVIDTVADLPDLLERLDG
jgi:phosphonoacetaldehyde hydrolase